MTAVLLAMLAGHAVVWMLHFEVKFWRHYRRTPRLTKDSLEDEALSPVAVIVPARNEEVAIGRAVRSLCELDYPNLQVICANDQSTDRTGEILAQLAAEFPERLTVINVPDPPEGWMGKCHAVFHAVRRAREETAIYLFTDADVIHAPDTLRRAVSHLLQEDADLLAISPRVDCVGFWENVVLAPFMQLGVVQLNPRHLNDPRRREIVGIGAFTLIRRAMYERWGGHHAIRGETIDDMAMGLMTKRAGGRLLLVREREAVHLRMYDSLPAIVRGFEKNIHTAVGSHPLRAFMAGFGMLALHCTPALALVYTLCAGGPLWLAALAAGLYLLTGLLIVERSRLFLTLSTAAVMLGYPLGSLVAFYIMVIAAWHAEVGGVVRWRGRTLKRPKQKTRLV